MHVQIVPIKYLPGVGRLEPGLEIVTIASETSLDAELIAVT